jgi:hypothetical protein
MNRSRVFISVLCAGILAAQSPPSRGTFTSTGNMTTPRFGHTATLLPGGKVLIAGGSSAIPGPALATADLYDPSTGTFAATGNMTMPRWGHNATLLPNGKVLITSGVDEYGSSSGDSAAELYDPSTGTFTPTSGLTTGIPVNATLLGNGKVLIVGRNRIGQTTFAELYDPGTDTFEATGVPANTADYLSPSVATLLSDGKVLIAGTRLSVNAELYDPFTGTFKGTVPPLPVDADCALMSTLLLNGKVLFVGIDCPFTVAQFYDPTADAFAGSGTITTDNLHTATLLPNGVVLFIREPALASGIPAGGELYDPVTGTFSSAGELATPGRVLSTATLLPDGTVLIAGGMNYCPNCSVTSSAELFKPPVPIPAPVLFSLSGNGQGQGAIWNAATGQIASPDNPAIAGEALSMYTTSLVHGGVIPPQVAVGGGPAEIMFFGDAPGYPGYYQVNFRVPSDVKPGSAALVHLTYLGRSSNEVTLAVRP